MTHAFDRMTQLGREFFADSLKSAATVARGMQSVVVETGECSRECLEKSASAFEKMARADDVNAVISASGDCARAIIETSVSRSARVADLYAEMARETVRPFDRFYKQD